MDEVLTNVLSDKQSYLSYVCLVTVTVFPQIVYFVRIRRAYRITLSTRVTCLACINHSREYNTKRLDVSTDTVDSFDLCHIYRQSVGNGQVDNTRASLPFSREGTNPQVTFVKHTGMRRITTFRSTERINDGVPIRL